MRAARVRQALAEVETTIARANACGELHWFNQAYRQWRANGGHGLTYGMARERLHEAVARRVAEGGTLGPGLLPEVFPGAFLQRPPPVRGK